MEEVRKNNRIASFLDKHRRVSLGVFLGLNTAGILGSYVFWLIFKSIWLFAYLAFFLQLANFSLLLNKLCRIDVTYAVGFLIVAVHWFLLVPLSILYFFPRFGVFPQSFYGKYTKLTVRLNLLLFLFPIFMYIVCLLSDPDIYRAALPSFFYQFFR